MSGVAGEHTLTILERRGLTIFAEGRTALSVAIVTQHQPDAHEIARRLTACWNALDGIPTDQLSTLLGEVRRCLRGAVEYMESHRTECSRPYPLDKCATLLAKLPVQS